MIIITMITMTLLTILNVGKVMEEVESSKCLRDGVKMKEPFSELFGSFS